MRPRDESSERTRESHDKSPVPRVVFDVSNFEFHFCGEFSPRVTVVSGNRGSFLVGFRGGRLPPAPCLLTFASAAGGSWNAGDFRNGRHSSRLSTGLVGRFRRRGTARRGALGLRHRAERG